MASLTPKVLKGRTYYYARECQRVDGKPTIVKTIYLGSLDHIVQSVTQAQQPLRPQTARLASFGDVAQPQFLSRSRSEQEHKPMEAPLA